MPESPTLPRDLVEEILAQTIDRLRDDDNFDSTLLSRLEPMLRDGLPKQGRDLKSMLTEDNRRE